MKKTTALFALLILFALLVTGCTLPARGTPPPTAATTSSIPEAATPTMVSIDAGDPTDTGIQLTATPLPAVTDTPVAGPRGALDWRLQRFVMLHREDQLPDGAAYELRDLAPGRLLERQHHTL